MTTPMAFPEVFTALQQGTVDGQENPLSGDHVGQVRPGAKAPVADRPRLLACIFLMNKASFDKLSAADKQALPGCRQGRRQGQPRARG
jgi:TRAP-type C4-dicarboxylate transport system substrate-binding protein